MKKSTGKRSVEVFEQLNSPMSAHLSIQEWSGKFLFFSIHSWSYLQYVKAQYLNLNILCSHNIPCVYKNMTYEFDRFRFTS